MGEDARGGCEERGGREMKREEWWAGERGRKERLDGGRMGEDGEGEGVR